MRKILSLVFLMSVVTACVQDWKKPIPESELQDDHAKPLQISDLPWSAVMDSATQKITMVQSDEVEVQDLDSSNVTEVLTRKYPEIKIFWLKQNKDTAFVRIPDASFLTQSSGNMGSDIFMAEVTYSFTEIPGIKFVNFDFAEGEHASPGTYQRSNFSF